VGSATLRDALLDPRLQLTLAHAACTDALDDSHGVADVVIRPVPLVPVARDELAYAEVADACSRREADGSRSGASR
jgi:hypothetical protein